VSHVNLNARPQSLTELFESMRILSDELIATMLRKRIKHEGSWYQINQSVWDLQDLLVNFQGKIENLTLNELSCRAICSFEDYAQKFINRKRIFISRDSNESMNANYTEVRERAENTARLLKEICKNLDERFEQLIYEKVAAKKKSCSVEGSEYC
jgi:hypothetical protein